MTARRIARSSWVAFVFSLLASGNGSAAVTQRQQIDLATVTNAHYRAHHLVGNCVTSPDRLGSNRESVESYIQILEAVELTRSVAAQYRSSIVKIELGLEYFQQARQANGKRRSQLVALANEAMRAAAVLLDLAVKLFDQVQPQLVRFFASAQRGNSKRGQNNGDGRETDFPVKWGGTPFHDCVPKLKDKIPRCCRDNYDLALQVLDAIAKDLTLEEKAAIRRCLNDTLARCRQLYDKNDILFNKEYWEQCFEGYVIFK